MILLLISVQLPAQLQDSLVSFFPHQLEDTTDLDLEQIAKLYDQIVLRLGQNLILEQACPEEELKGELTQVTADINYWLDKAFHLRRFGQVECALKLLQHLNTYATAYALPERMLLESHLAFTWSEYLGDYQKALQHMRTALSLMPITTEGVAWTYYVAGRVNHRLANFSEAYEHTQLALSLARVKQDRKLEARSLGSLALINRDVFFGESLKAVPFHEGAIDIAENLRDTAVLLNEWVYLAANYGEARQHTRYFELIQRALDIARVYKEIRIEEKILINYGAFLSLQGMYQKAENLFLIALDLARKMNKRSIISHLHYQLFEVQLMQGKAEEAYQVLADGLQEGVLDSALLQEQLYAVERLRGDRIKALQHLENAYRAVKGQYMDRNAAMLSLWETQLKTQESYLEVARQRERLVVEQHRSNLYTYLLLVVGLLFIVAIYAFYYQRKTSRKLVTQNQQIEKQAQKLRQLHDLKSRFFTNVSHELRTPLSLILGPIQSVLNRTKLEEEDRHLLSMAAKNGEQLSHLVNEILDFSKLESQPVGIRETPLNLYLFLSQLIDHFEYIRLSKEIDFTFDFQANQDMRLDLDKQKMEKVINNLLSNAFKFTEPGGQIVLRVQDEGETWLFQLQDSGQGIAPEDLPHIFERFYQSAHGPINKEGTGIGLALSYQYVKLFEGEMWVESELGNGSLFQFRLPKKLSQSEAADTSGDIEVSAEPVFEEWQSRQEMSEQPQILVVEDNGDLRTYLSYILGKQFRVRTATHGGEALAYLATAPILPDLVISDWMMPVLDGFQLLDKLRTTSRYSRISVIMLTAKTNIHDKLTALRIGIDDYLVKPFIEEELLARVHNILRFHSQKEGDRIAAFEDKQKHNPTASGMAKAKHDLDWLAQLEQAVAKRLGDFNLTADRVAKAMLMSRAQLFRKIKMLTGLTVSQYIQEMRFQQARKLLENQTHRSVKAVALTVGFKQVKHFSQRFKDRFGRLPSSYF